MCRPCQVLENILSTFPFSSSAFVTTADAARANNFIQVLTGTIFLLPRSPNRDDSPCYSEATTEKEEDKNKRGSFVKFTIFQPERSDSTRKRKSRGRRKEKVAVSRVVGTGVNHVESRERRGISERKVAAGYRKEDKGAATGRGRKGRERQRRIGNAHHCLRRVLFLPKTFSTQPLSLLARAIDILEIQTPRKTGLNVRVAGQGTTCIRPITKEAEPAPDDPTRRVLRTFDVQTTRCNLEPSATPFDGSPPPRNNGDLFANLYFP